MISHIFSVYFLMVDITRAHMKLTIKNLHVGDFGNYRCISKNSLGETEGSIRVYGTYDIIFFSFLHFTFLSLPYYMHNTNKLNTWARNWLICSICTRTWKTFHISFTIYFSFLCTHNIKMILLYLCTHRKYFVCNNLSECQ